MNKLDTILIFGVVSSITFGCSQKETTKANTDNSKSNETTISGEDVAGVDGLTFVYASIDSVVTIDNKTYSIHVDQVDYTNLSYIKNDTLPRPTYGCHFTIRDEASKIICQDSVFRDSWGYPGKISSIDAYQIALPEIIAQDKEIQLRFKVYDYATLDAILGVFAIRPVNKEIRLFWEESSIEED